MCLYVLCSLYAPLHQNKFQVGVNLLGNKYYSDSDSDSEAPGDVCVSTGLPGPGVLHAGGDGGFTGKPSGETPDVSPEPHLIFI